MKNNSLTPKKFQKNLLDWFDQYGRKDLPWQHNKNPYRVWLSEIMLQQTQVSTVIPYFLRFVSMFPTLETLANASTDEVLHLWTGLGYYSRARNLHKTSKIICEKYGGQFPNSLEKLSELPGIGRSTAGAILASAFEKKGTILDGNVKRVLTRLHAIEEWPGERKTHDKLWEIATTYTPAQRIADYTQAIMDLGATLCTRKKPNCITCPFSPDCLAFQTNQVSSIPRKKATTILPLRQKTFLILKKEPHYILLEKRDQNGIWGGLWSLPEMPEFLDKNAIKKYCRKNFYSPLSIHLGAKFRHTFSHFHLDILPAYIPIQDTKPKIMEDNQQIWYNLQQPQSIGLPGPVKKLLMRLI